MTTSAPVIDSELDLLFKQSNAVALKEVTNEDIISQLSKKPQVVSAETSVPSAEDKETTEDSKENEITRRQRKDILCDPQEKQERTLFLGNLSVSCATDKILIKSLKARFTPYGPVEAIRFRSIPFAEPQARRVAFIKKNFRKDGTGGTCNGYVVMETREAAVAALKENATMFGDRHLRVDLACEGDGSTKTNTKKSIFIGNLPMDLEEEPVWQLFGKCGAVTNVRLIRDKVTNMGKGIGYVTFAGKDSVDIALKLAGTMLGKRPVRVSPCSKIGMVEKKKTRASNLAEKRQKQAAALVKANPSAASSSNLGAAKSSTTDIPFINEDDAAAAAKKVSKKEAKLQAELQTKFGQLFHKKFPFAQAISEVDKTNENQKKSSESSKSSKSVSFEKKTYSSSDSKVEKKSNASGDRKSYASIDKKPYSSEKKPYSSEKKPYLSEKKPYSSEKKPYLSEKKPYSSEKKAYSSEKKPYSSEKKAYSVDKKPYSADKKPYATDKKPYSNDKKPYSTDKKPYATDKKPYSTDKKSFPSAEKKSYKSFEKPAESKVEKSSVFKPTKILPPTVRAARVEKPRSDDFKNSSKKQH